MFCNALLGSCARNLCEDLRSKIFLQYFGLHLAIGRLRRLYKDNMKTTRPSQPKEVRKIPIRKVHRLFHASFRKDTTYTN